MSNKSTLNYWIWSDSELIEELKVRKIDLEPYARREAIALLKEYDTKKGTAKDVSIEEIDQDGKAKALMMNELRKEDPKLMVTTVMFMHSGEQDLPYVFVGHNGKAFYIPKEAEVEVPDYILGSCIKDAVEDRMVPTLLQNGDIKWVIRKVQRYPYSVIVPSHPLHDKEE